LADDERPRVRLAAARVLAERGDRAALLILIRLAAAEEQPVRLESIQILRALTGENFGLNAYLAPTTQVEAHRKWQAWAEFEGRTAELALPLALRPLPEDLGQGLLLHYTFDSDAEKGPLADSSGHRRSGTIHGDGRIVAGLLGQGLRLTGADHMGDAGGHASLPHLDLASLTEFTLSLWVKESGLTHPEGEAYIVFGADRGVGIEDSIGISHFNGSLVYRVGEGAVSVPYEAKDRDRWVHYALTFAAGRLRAYRDARLVGEAPARVSQVGKQAALGRHWWHHGVGTSTRFIGELDDVRVYDRSLSTQQIEMLRQIAAEDK
jgi:hypothetical protein